ncbi:MAG TPA: hypothetical protein VF623_07705 [Segetibacter sp.]|jgi:hypothetical protein
MKKLVLTSLLAVLVIGLTSTGCKKIVKAVFPGIDVPLSNLVVPVPANQNPLLLPPAYTGELPPVRLVQRFNLDSLIKANTANQFGIGDVSSVKLKEMTFTIVDGATQTNNFQNFESFRIGFSSNSNSTVAQIASYSFPDTYSTTASINTANTPELISYLSGGELYYDLTVKPRRASNAMSVRLNAVVSVK